MLQTLCLRVCQYMFGRSKQSSAVTVPVTATVQTCVLKSVVMGSLKVFVCCALVSLPEAHVGCHDGSCGACVFVHTHMCVLQKQRVRGRASACRDIVELAQLPVCCPNFCSAWGRRRCDHVISRTHLCCRHFVTMFIAWDGVSADTTVLQNSSWGHSV